MRLSVSSNYDPKLVDGLAEFPVEEVYGKLPADCLGGGRARSPLSLGDPVCGPGEGPG